MTRTGRSYEAEGHSLHPRPPDEYAKVRAHDDRPLFSMPGEANETERLTGAGQDGHLDGSDSRDSTQSAERQAQPEGEATDHLSKEAAEPTVPSSGSPRSLTGSFFDTFLGRQTPPQDEGKPSDAARQEPDTTAHDAVTPQPDAQTQQEHESDAGNLAQPPQELRAQASARPPGFEEALAPAGMAPDDFDAWQAREREALEAEAEQAPAQAAGIWSVSASPDAAEAPEPSHQKKRGFWAWFWGRRETTEPQAEVQEQQPAQTKEVEAPARVEAATPVALQPAASPHPATSAEARQIEEADVQPMPPCQPEAPEDTGEKEGSSGPPRRTFLDWFLGRLPEPAGAEAVEETAETAEQPQATTTEPTAEAVQMQPLAVTSAQEAPVTEPQGEPRPEAQPSPVEETAAGPEGVVPQPREGAEMPEAGSVEEPPVPEERLEALVRESRRGTLLDDLSPAGEAVSEEAEEGWAEEIAEEPLRKAKRKPARLARIGAGLALILIAVAVIKMHDAAQLRNFLAQPIAGRAVVAAQPAATGAAEQVSVESIMTTDVPAFGQLLSLVGTRPDNQPPSGVAGRYYYKGSWPQLLARLEAPPETLQLMLIPLAVSAQKEADRQEPGYEDVVATIEPRGGEILVTCTEARRWPPNEVFECFAYTGGETADAVRDVNGPLALDTWAQAGRKDPKPVTEADLGRLVRVVNEAGRQIWPIKVETTTLPNGAVRTVHELEKGTVTVTRGALPDGRRYEEWSASTLPGYKLVAIWSANKEWAKDEDRIAVLLGRDLRPILACGKLPLWPGTMGTWCRWYAGAGPQCNTVEECVRALRDATGVQVVISTQGTVVAALRREGTHATLRELLDPESEWRARWHMRPVPANEREARLLRRLGYATGAPG